MTYEITAKCNPLQPFTVSTVIVAVAHGGRGANCPQLSQHSALMGGQFSTKKRQGTFKNPLFYEGGRGANRPKNELSDLNALKTGFQSVFSL